MGGRSPRVLKKKGSDQDEELADLQRRFTALADEDQPRISTPRSTVRREREREVVAAVRTENESELNRLDDQITTLRRKHDELAHANMEKRRELEKLTDRLHDLNKEAAMPSAEDNSTQKEIKALEQRLQKAVAKYEDAYEVRKTYEQIVKRLKEERIGFANQLEARELTLRAKESDYEELLLMSHDANQSKEVAKAELTRFEALVSDERKLREKELQERRSLVAKKQEINAELERKEKVCARGRGGRWRGRWGGAGTGGRGEGREGGWREGGERGGERGGEGQRGWWRARDGRGTGAGRAEREHEREGEATAGGRPFSPPAPSPLHPPPHAPPSAAAHGR